MGFAWSRSIPAWIYILVVCATLSGRRTNDLSVSLIWHATATSILVLWFKRNGEAQSVVEMVRLNRWG